MDRDTRIGTPDGSGRRACRPEPVPAFSRHNLSVTPRRPQRGSSCCLAPTSADLSAEVWDGSWWTVTRHENDGDGGGLEYRLVANANAADPAGRLACVGYARHALRSTATGWGITGPALDDLLTVASELIANAATHKPARHHRRHAAPGPAKASGCASKSPPAGTAGPARRPGSATTRR
ncbi:hypothetical protein [Kitasatospora azatica]|uniref:hypothetical protein n=1 Tax=Kitasatospora azatica TaxID=58347 RepID=UPI00055A7A20|nr:hypothetical protein [Kitasatospora azatica]